MTDLPAEPPRVGFVGLGKQGAPIAHRIIAAGYPTTLWARRDESLEPFRTTEAATVSSPAALGAASDILGVCVVDDDDVRAVLLGPGGALARLREGAIVAIHSTVHPATCQEVADAARVEGVAVVDAPVSGGPAVAAAGRLLVLVGGTDEDAERVRPVLTTFGDPVIHLGPLGSGQLAKVINNALMVAQLGLADDALRVGAALHLDPTALGTALSHGSGASTALDVRRRLTDGLGQFPAGALLRKDADILRSVTEAPPVDLGALGGGPERTLAVLGFPGGPPAAESP
jgi:3-hydroxyisobutyrate dehydrogenase-like beta-hydroxyacid dehydrogenase